MASEKFEIITEAAVPAMAVRKRTTVDQLPEDIGKAYQAIMTHMAMLGETVAGMPYVAYFNLDMEDLDVEMGFPTAQKLPDNEEVTASEIPAGKWLTAMYKGPYEQMATTYVEMAKYVEDLGLEASGIAYEYYYNSPVEVPETELLTKIAFLLK